MKQFPTLTLVAVFVIALCLPAFSHAGDGPAAPSVQKSVQKTPVQKVPELRVEIPKATQKTPVQKEVIQKGTCEGPCCQKTRFRFRSRTVTRERGRLLSRTRGVECTLVRVCVPGCLVTVGGGAGK